VEGVTHVVHPGIAVTLRPVRTPLRLLVLQEDGVPVWSGASLTGDAQRLRLLSGRYRLVVVDGLERAESAFTVDQDPLLLRPGS